MWVIGPGKAFGLPRACLEAGSGNQSWEIWGNIEGYAKIVAFVGFLCGSFVGVLWFFGVFMGSRVAPGFYGL
jgi:hypothetical protein